MNRWLSWLPMLLICGMPIFAHAAQATSSQVASSQAAPSPPAAFAADFVQTRSLPGFDRPLTSHGQLSWSKADGFRWEITKPYHYQFVMRDGKAREVLPDGSTRTLAADQTPWLASVQHIFVSALSGDHRQLRHYFTIHSQPLADGHGRRLELLPISDALGTAIKRIEVIESAPGQPRELSIFETSGGHMRMRFTPRSPGH